MVGVGRTDEPSSQRKPGNQNSANCFTLSVNPDPNELVPQTRVHVHVCATGIKELLSLLLDVHTEQGLMALFLLACCKLPYHGNQDHPPCFPAALFNALCGWDWHARLTTQSQGGEGEATHRAARSICLVAGNRRRDSSLLRMD